MGIGTTASPGETDSDERSGARFTPSPAWNPLGTYIVRRLLQGIPVLLIISAIVFAVVAFIPGDPAAVILGHAATPENVAALRHQMGLDKPLPLGSASWLSG